ncbi:MAG: hypothetical protein AB7V32_10915, partial [Candidatus Berkiella sp.]
MSNNKKSIENVLSAMNSLFNSGQSKPNSSSFIKNIVNEALSNHKDTKDNNCKDNKPPKCEDDKPKEDCKDNKPPKCDDDKPKEDCKNEKPPKCDDDKPKEDCKDDKPPKCDDDKPKEDCKDDKPPKCDDDKPKEDCKDDKPPKCDDDKPKEHCDDDKPPHCDEEPPKCDDKHPDAKNDCDAICVVETVCGCDGKDPTVKSATKAQGNLLENDKADCAQITQVKSNGNTVTPDAHGIISIQGIYGTLTLHTSGNNAGQYCYELNEGVVPQDCAKDEFCYTIVDKNGCEDSAELKIDLQVKLEKLPEPDANNDCDAICVVETVCGCDGKDPTVKSATKATGNLLANDQKVDCASITQIKFGDTIATPDACGDIRICGQYGNLLVHTTGEQAGQYCYELKDGAVPPDCGAKENFCYTVETKDGCKDSAELNIDLDVKLIKLPEPDANNDCDAICVVETVCGCDGKDPTVKSATKATGNLLANDQKVDCASITQIKFGDTIATPDACGDIRICGQYGNLLVHTTGEQAGQYCYELKDGAVPPDCGAKENFCYTVET